MTMAEFTKLCSSVIQCMNFTFDIPELNSNGCMPVLDVQIWMEVQHRKYGIPAELMADRPVNSGQLVKLIVYKFYKKPMSRKTPPLSKTALPENIKVSTVSNEVIR